MDIFSLFRKLTSMIFLFLILLWIYWAKIKKRPEFVEFTWLGVGTKKSIPYRFDRLNPCKEYNGPDVLGNYEWTLDSSLVVNTDYFDSEEVKKELKPGTRDNVIAEMKNRKRVRISQENFLSYTDFQKFMLKKYNAFVTDKQKISPRQSNKYTYALVTSFLSCPPKKAVYTMQLRTDKEKIYALKNGYISTPMFIDSIIGIFDLKRGEYFELVIGEYDPENLNFYGKFSPQGLPELAFYPIQKIPVFFDPYNPSGSVGFIESTYTPQLGNYVWALYQFRFSSLVDIGQIISDDTKRNHMLPVGQSSSSKVVNYEEVFDFLVRNYRGWGPYAEGMEEEKALQLSKKLIPSFLKCNLDQAIYINYTKGFSIRNENSYYVADPVILDGVYVIIDPINNEFFELIMGAND